MKKTTPKLSSLLRRAALLLPLLCLSWLAQAQSTYFNAGSLSFATTGGADNRQVQFKVQETFTILTEFRSPIVVGEVRTTAATIDFGDGTAPEPVNLTVLSKSTERELGTNFFTGEYTTIHTYATPGRYLVTVRGQSRLTAGNVMLTTVVEAGAANDSPVSLPAPLVVLNRESVVPGFVVQVSDPNGDALTYSLATPAETGDASGRVNPSGLSIDNSRSGLVRFNTADKTDNFYTVVVKVSDGKTSILVDQLIQLIGVSLVNTAPIFTAPGLADGFARQVAPGQTISFVVRAIDNNAGDIVTLSSVSLPPGATLTPALPVSGNPVESTFSWTPTAAQAGTYQVVFTATDSKGLSVSTNVLIQVTPSCDPTATRPVANLDRFTSLCGPLTITEGQLLSNDTDPNGRLLHVSTVGSPSNGTLVQNGGTYTFTPTPGFVGTASFTYQVLVSGGGLSNPDVASPTTGHYYEFFSSPGICWREALRQASLRSYNGLQGYLATITSADEAALLSASYPGKDNSKSYWFGASDGDVEGEWRWKSGPEAGQLFWRGGPDGTAVGFSNWSPGQPDDFKNQYRPQGEDFGQFYGSSGLWNDVDECGTSASAFGFVIEYGGLEACTPALYATGTVTINVAASATAAGPVANPDFYTYSRGPKQRLFLTDADLLRNDTDPLGRPLQVRDISTPSAGQFFVFQTGPTGEFTYNYSPPTGFVGKATFTYLLQLAGPVLALPATGHYYEYVSAPGICWADAQKAAAARTYNGMGGYLATITSAAESDFLKRFQGRNWFGASDAAVEGEWRWQTGPEAGQLFWRGGPDGTAVGYANWSSGQPDDFKNQYRPQGEDYGMVYGGSGLWNDLANCGDGSTIDGYLVEYGGLEACTPVLYSVGTVTVDVPFSPYFTLVGAPASAATQAAGKSAGSPAVLEALPNPSAGQFRLRVTAATDGAAQLDVYDLQGRRVKAVFAGSLRAGEVRELAVDAPELASGVYLVRLQSGSQVQHLRIVVQK